MIDLCWVTAEREILAHPNDDLSNQPNSPTVGLEALAGSKCPIAGGLQEGLCDPGHGGWGGVEPSDLIR